MNRYRWLVMLLGPLPIVVGSVGVARWARSTPLAVAGNQAVIHRDAQSAQDESAPSTMLLAAVDQDELDRACERRAETITRQLGKDCAVIIRAPFVLGGNMAPDELEEWHRRTIGPAARAMAREYFRQPPREPITVLLFTDESAYDQYAKQLFGDEGISVYGYYKPHLRTLVMNIGTGGGTLVHELTHALADFDFPTIPDWFNEGLASLHEECRIKPDESGIEGLVNWRLPGLQKTIHDGRLQSIQQLTERDDFRGAEVGLNYAQARYLCLFLQSRGQLSAFFEQFRSAQQDDPRGQLSLLDASGAKDWATLDREFQAWVMTLEPRR